MATSSSCCCVSSHGHGHGLYRPLHRLRTASPARLRLVFPSVPSPRFSSRRIPASPDPPLDVAAGDATREDDWPAPDDDDDQDQEDRDELIGFQIQVSKVGKRNRRLVRARVRVHAPLEAVWATLTDYEGLADFIPGLSECRLLDQHDGFARIYQVGEQDLALGFKFNAKGTIDCYEGDMEVLPDAGARRREIAFNMIDGDFKLFQGKWSVEEGITSARSRHQESCQCAVLRPCLHSFLLQRHHDLVLPIPATCCFAPSGLSAGVSSCNCEKGKRLTQRKRETVAGRGRMVAAVGERWRGCSLRHGSGRSPGDRQAPAWRWPGGGMEPGRTLLLAPALPLTGKDFGGEEAK